MENSDFGFVNETFSSQSYNDNFNGKETTLPDLLNALHEMAFITDVEGTVLLANKAFAKTVGKRIEKLKGTKFYNLPSGGNIPLKKSQMERVVHTGKPAYFEDTYSDKYIQNIIHPIVNKKGKVKQLLITGIETTEQRQAEQTLPASEAGLQTLSEISTVGIFRTDKRGRCIYVNEKWCQITGLSSEEAFGEGWTKTLHPDDRERVFKEWHSAAREEVPFQSEYRFQHPNGKTTWVLGQASAQKGASGEVIGYVGTITDISEMKRLELELQRYREQLEVLVNERTGELKKINIQFQRQIKERRKIGVKLRESEVFYQQLFDLNPDATALYRARDGKILTVNNAMLQLAKAEKLEELIGKQALRFVHPDYRTLVTTRIQKMLKEGKKAPLIEEKFIDLHGNVIVAEVTAIPLTLEGESVVLIVIRDITVRKRTEESLREANENYINLVNSVDGIVWEADVGTGKFKFISKQAEKILGYPLEMWLNEPDFWKKHIHPDDQGWVVNYLETATAEKRPQQLEYRMIAADGREVWLRNVVSVMVENDQPVKLRGLIIDITIQKQAEEALRQSEERFRDISYSMADWIWEVDTNGRYTFCSGKVKEILGYRPHELIGKTPFELMPKNEGDRVGKIFRKILAQKKSFRDLENWNIHKNGQMVCLLSNGKPIINEQGKLTGYRGVDKDITQRKKAELQFRNLFENVPVGLYRTTPDGRIIMANPALIKMLGFSSFEELAEKNLEESGFESDYSRAEFKRILEKKGQILGLTSARKRKDGGILFIRENARAVRDETGNIRYYEGSIEDVTAYKRQEETLRKLSGVIEQTADLVLITNKEGIIEYVNPAFQKITGYEKEEIVGETPNILKSGKHDKEFYKNLWKTIRSGEVFNSVFINRKKNGELFYEEKTITPLRDSRRKITHFVSTGKDITKQKQAEETTRKSEAKYRRFFMEDLTGDYVSTADGKILLCNPAFAKIFGFDSTEEVMKYNMSSFYTNPADREEFLNLLKKEKKLYNHEIELRDRYGNPRHIVQNVVGHFNDKNELVEIQGYLIDVTKRKKLEEQFRQAQKMEAIGKLAGGVAHDFNNLLTVISGYSGLLLQRLVPDEPMYREIQQIAKAGERAAALTDQLLAFSRRQVIQPRIVNLNTIVLDTKKMLRRLIGEDIEIITSLSSNLDNVKVDPGQMDQVIINLAVNARDAMPMGGKLIIETANFEIDHNYKKEHVEIKEGCYVMLAVSDTGSGMSKEIQSRIFEPFFTTKERGKGTGLGLSTVYGIVKQNNGYIWVYSEPEKGTAFKIYFPRVEEEASVSEVQQFSPESLQGNETVLIVEDEEYVRELAGRILGENGYSVLKAEDGYHALQVAQQYQRTIHLLLTDVVMPKMSGKELSEKIEALHSGIKVVFFSGYTDDAILYHQVLDPNINFIQKPFTPPNLLKKIREVLDRN